MIPASSKASAAAACSPSSAPTAASKQLERLHRFTHRWEAAASLQLRSGDPQRFDAYEAHGRIVPGTLDEHLARIADTWIDQPPRGRTIALVASTNDHVDTINRAVQQARLDAGHLDPDVATRIAGGDHAHVGDVVATRRNDRRLTTTTGEPVRNRDTWTVTAINARRVDHRVAPGGHGHVTLPADYVASTRPARLRGDRARLAIRHRRHRYRPHLAGHHPARPVRRRHPGRDEQHHLRHHRQRRHRRSPRRPRGILAVDRADIPATTQRRTLAQSTPRQATPERRR